MKHLLLVSHFFPPMGGGGVQRVTKFVKYLALHGWRATIVCGRAEDYWMRDESLLQEIPDSARVLRTAGASGLGALRRLRGGALTERRSSRGFGVLRRTAAWFLVPDSYVGWKPFALRAAATVLAADAPDAVLSSGPPDTNHVVALSLARRHRIPWLADFRDPWVGLHLHTPPTAWHRRRQEALERAVLATAGCLVATTAWLRDLLRQRAPAGARVQVIRNGYDAIDFAGVTAAPADASAPLRLAHVGMLTTTRTAVGLLHGLARVHEREPGLRGQIQLELVGARESVNDTEIAALGLQECVHVQGYVDHANAIAAMARADVLVLVKHTDPRYVGLVPGKLYEYLGARRPILALVPESEAASLVRELGCGEIAPPDDPERIAAALGALLAAKRAGALAERYTCRTPERFQRSEQARTLAALLEILVAGGVGARR